MGYKAIDDVRPGSYLGQTIFSEKGSILLRKGIKLTQNYIDRLKKQGYQSLIVFTEHDRDLELPEVISSKIRHSAVVVVQSMFETIPRNGSKKSYRNLVHQVDAISNEIFTEIENNNSLALDLVNLKCVSSYTFEHSVNVAVLSGFLGMQSGLNMVEVRNLIKAGLFHDIGKTFVKSEILQKPASLSAEELEEIQKHPGSGFKLLLNQMDVSPIISIGSRLHHERWDGTGYPDGIQGEDIHQFGRIIAVADVFDAMTSDRVYRRALPHAHALEYIAGQRGRHFDPMVVDTLLNKMYPYPVGSAVKLNTGDIATVMENHLEEFEKPTVKITSAGASCGKIISLSASGSTIRIIKPI